MAYFEEMSSFSLDNNDFINVSSKILAEGIPHC